MRMIVITLVGYTRFNQLKNIRKFTMTPHEVAQIIIGSNGSGKSGLLEQLSPLPPEKDAFTKDGSKTIEYLHNGQRIVCHSVFMPSPHHSFMVDGEEKNPGGTEKIQRERCYEYFGMTQDIHDLMRGAVKFSAMSVSERREWFTRLCITDYDFAMDAYNKINKRHNQLKGALDMTRKNLVTETAKVVTADEETKLEEEVAVLLSELDILSRERMPVEKSSSHYATERDKALASLSETSMRLLKNRVTVPLEYADGRQDRDDWGRLKRASFSSVDEIDVEIDRLRHTVTTKEVLINTTTEMFHRQQKKHDTLIAAGQNGIAGLLEQQRTWFDDITALQRRRKLEVVISQPDVVLRSLEAIKAPLFALLESMPNNTDRHYGKRRLQELNVELVATETSRIEIVRQVNQHVAKLEHADEHRGSGKLTCPKCEHRFVVGISEEAYANVKRLAAEGQAELAKLEERQAVLRKDIAEVEAYITQYREFLGYTEKASILAPLWQHLVAGQFVVDSPAEAINQIRFFERDTRLRIDIVALEAKIEESVRIQKATEEVGEASLVEVDATLATLTQKLGEYTAQLTALQHAISSYQQYRKQILYGQQLAEEVKRIYKHAETSQHDLVEAMRRESINHCISQVQHVLAMKQESLRGIKTQKAIVQTLERQITEFSVQEEAAGMMVEALSPKNGLIAEGLLGFIRNFVGQMNAFVNRIWTYPLRTIPTGYNIESGEQSSELDYKFKLLVGTGNRPVKDISKGSDGQKEVIDMAFQMTALLYLNLANAPLLFDEFGRTLDAAHRFNANAEIKSILENRNHNQMFMVSHYAESYLTFNHAEICVLDDSNLTLPTNRSINTHVVMN